MCCLIMCTIQGAGCAKGLHTCVRARRHAGNGAIENYVHAGSCALAHAERRRQPAERQHGGGGVARRDAREE